MQHLTKKLSARELRLLLLGTGTIAIALAVASLVVPKVKTLRASTKAVNVLERASLDGRELERLLQDRHQRIEALKRQLHGNMAELPPRQVEAFVIGRLQKVSWSNDVELVSVEPAIGDRVESFQEMLFDVRLIGEYSNLYHWLVEAREELGYVVVKEYGLTRHDNIDDQPLLMANLSLASYRVLR